MERYSYVAVDSHKKRIRGQILAQDEKQLSDLLFNLDLYLVSCKKLKTTTPNSFFTLSGSIKIKDIAVFCKQFGTMINSGVSIVETLESLSVQPAYPQMMRLTLQQVLGDVTSGLLLSEAMSKHKKIFPEFFLSMISVGEASGKLDTVFLNMGDYYDNQVRIKSKMISAISYPVFLLVMTIGVVAIISFVVVPQFQKVFAELGQELPQITQMVFDFAEFVKNNWMVIVLVVFGVIITIIALKRTKKESISSINWRRISSSRRESSRRASRQDSRDVSPSSSAAVCRRFRLWKPSPRFSATPFTPTVSFSPSPT